MTSGDYLFYTDSGAYYIDKIQHLISSLNQTNQDVMPFELVHIEKQYSKRDAFILMGCDSEEYTDTPQILATFILIRKSDFSVNFFTEYLNYATDERILADIPSQSPNYPDFIAHRHDQTIFSLLCKKYKLLTFRDPSETGEIPLPITDSVSNYPRIMVLYRRAKLSKVRRREFKKILRHKTNEFLKKIAAKNDYLAYIINFLSKKINY